MKQLRTIDKNFSTTRLTYKLLPEDYLDGSGRVKEEFKFKINFPELGIRDSKIPKQGEEKFDTWLFLPPGEGRQGEGGLRTRGYFKFSYEIENGRWYACDFRGRRLFEVEPPEGLEIDLEQFKRDDGIIRLPLITVITVVLNGEKYLEETIQSVINQTYPNVEYIIIDCCSTDRTLDIVKKYEGCIDYCVSEEDKGIYDAMNKGVKLSTGECIGILNSDDYYFEDTLNLVVSYALLEDNIDIVYGNLKLIDDNMESLVKSNLKKKVYCYRLYDISYVISGDYDLISFLKKEEKVFCYVPHVLSAMRKGGLTNKKFWRATLETFKVQLKYSGFLIACGCLFVRTVRNIIFRHFLFANNFIWRRPCAK